MTNSTASNHSTSVAMSSNCTTIDSTTTTIIEGPVRSMLMTIVGSDSENYTEVTYDEEMRVEPDKEEMEVEAAPQVKVGVAFY